MQDLKSPQALFTAVAVLVIVVLGASYLYVNRPTPAAAPDPEGESLEIPGLGSVSVNTPGVILEQAGPVSGIPPRDFTIPLSFEASASAEVRTALQIKFEETQDALSKDKTDFNAWIRLGALRKQGGDYIGAAADWEYVSKLYPENIVSFGNLGGLYLDFLKDYPKAESNYKQQIKNSPGDENAYHTLYSLYTDYGHRAGTSAGEDILKAGIVANSDSISLRVLLARHYAGKGDFANANLQYDAAIAAARVAGNTQATAQLEAEKAAL